MPTILTESQKTKIELIKEHIGSDDDVMSDVDFSNALVELQEQGINVEQVLTEEYGVNFDE